MNLEKSSLKSVWDAKMILRLRQSGELLCDRTSQNLKFFLENISLKNKWTVWVVISTQLVVYRLLLKEEEMPPSGEHGLILTFEMY